MLFFQYLFFIYEDFLTLTQHLCHCPYAFHSTFSRAIFSHAPAEERAEKTRVQFQKLWQEVKRAKTEFTFHLPFVCLIFTKITEFMQKCETETGKKKIRQTFRRRGKKEREEKHALFTNIEIEHPECEN